jgi:hypothetical protein
MVRTRVLRQISQWPSMKKIIACLLRVGTRLLLRMISADTGKDLFVISCSGDADDVFL